MRTLLLLLLSLHAAPSAGEACNCPPPGPPCAEYWNAATIFMGRVESISLVPAGRPDADPLRLVTFSVIEMLKGPDARPTLQIRTPRGPCSPSFVVDRAYIIYASRDSDGQLATDMCSRSRPVDRAAEDVLYARNIAAGAPALGRISGHVVLRSRDLARARDRQQPMSNVSVILRKGEFSTRVRTNLHGAFTVDSLDAGVYDVDLDHPGVFRVTPMPARVELTDVRGCAIVNAAMHPDGTVAGRVVDDRHRPIEGLTIDLTVRNGLDQTPPAPGPERLRTVTRRDGTFELRGVPPGRFVIGLNTRHAGSVNPLPRVFHPGVITVSNAQLVTMAAGGRVEIGDFVVPSDVRFAAITGIVTDSSGAPAEGARVYLRGPDERDYILGLPVVADFVGRFIIAAPADRRYVVFAERDRPGSANRLDVTAPVPVTTGPDCDRLRLTLRRP
jgi:hypothetical protein